MVSFMPFVEIAGGKPKSQPNTFYEYTLAVPEPIETCRAEGVRGLARSLLSRGRLLASIGASRPLPGATAKGRLAC